MFGFDLISFFFAPTKRSLKIGFTLKAIEYLSISVQLWLTAYSWVSSVFNFWIKNKIKIDFASSCEALGRQNIQYTGKFARYSCKLKVTATVPSFMAKVFFQKTSTHTKNLLSISQHSVVNGSIPTKIEKNSKLPKSKALPRVSVWSTSSALTP